MKKINEVIKVLKQDGINSKQKAIDLLEEMERDDSND